MISDLFKHKQHDYKFAHSMFVHFKKLKARESLTTSGKKKKKKKQKGKQARVGGVYLHNKYLLNFRNRRQSVVVANANGVMVALFT